MTLFAIYQIWSLLVLSVLLWLYLSRRLYLLYRRNVRKIAFMFDAIDNADYAFKYATENLSADDVLVNNSLNRITQILFQARKDAQEREKYYELIINSINTGIIVLDDKGNIYQSNKEALSLIGLSVLTHTTQLARVDEQLQKLILTIKPGDKQQISFSTERGITHLSIRAASTKLRNKMVKILGISDINSELDENELDSWIRLTRVLTHEIMNSVTPITSLSETMLTKVGKEDKEIRSGLTTIYKTGTGLIDFVENYRKFTHLPTPSPSLFYVKAFAARMKELSLHQLSTSNITIDVDVEPADLIVFADENLISQVVLNLLKNAAQAIGTDQPNGRITIKAYCNKAEAVFIEVSNNGPLIPPEETDHIFVPFFTTKEEGSGIGLSISKQIMRLSGGTLTLKSDIENKFTVFTLMFP
jgi:nitrogen fixation/metabolism regulation signal transduction histidine kinase